jgi:hypothetical protein
MRANDESKIYRKQMIEFAKESKKSIKISSETILSELSDEGLGKLIRTMYDEVCKDADSRIEYLENQK